MTAPRDTAGDPEVAQNDEPAALEGLVSHGPVSEAAPEGGAPDASSGLRGMPPRSDAFRRFMALPLVFALLLMAAGLSVFVLAWMGGEATGDRVSIAFATECPAEALPVLAARAEAVGLGEPALRVEGGAVVIEATLPGIEGDRDSVPALLSRPGTLEVRDGQRLLVSRGDVTGSQVRLDEGGMPYAWVDLSEEAVTALTAAVDAAPDGELEIRVDGAQVAMRPNSAKIQEGGLRIVEPVEMTTRDRMRRAVDHSIVLQHGPLPCPVSPGAVETVAAGQPAG